MSKKLDEIISAELKIQKDIEKAQLLKEEMIEKKVEEGLLEANQIEEKTEKVIEELLLGKKERLTEINSKLYNIVKIENDKMIEQVSTKIKDVIEEIYKEALKND